MSMDSTSNLIAVKHELDAYFAKYGLRMSRQGIRDIATEELLYSCDNVAEMTRYGLQEVDKRAARREHHVTSPKDMPFVSSLHGWRPCVLRDEATGIEITGMGHLVKFKMTNETFVEFEATFDALPTDTQASLREKFGEQATHEEWSRIRIKAPVDQVHWIEKATD